MKVNAVKTRIVEAGTCSLKQFISGSITELKENTVVAITSKVVAICEGSVVPQDGTDKGSLIESESDYYLPKSGNKYNVYLTIKNNMLIPSSGVDESNANGYFIKWPANPQESAIVVWELLRKRFGLKNLGVILTDSVSSPLRWGVTGKCIAYCGFKGLFPRVGEPDLYGRKLKMTRVNIADALAASAVLCMGESNEQTPIALIEEIPFIEFSQQPPTDKELESMNINIEDDIYGQLLTAVNWQKGGSDTGRQ